jgi:hypothetical protein
LNLLVDDRQFGYTTKLKKKKTWNFQLHSGPPKCGEEILKKCGKERAKRMMMTMVMLSCQSKTLQRIRL